MSSKNEITGDSLVSKQNTKEYEENYDKIFCKHDWHWDGQTLIGDRWYCPKCKTTKDTEIDI